VPRFIVARHMSSGTLLVIRSSGREATVVSVPVRGPDGKVVGLVAAAIYLDELSRQIAREMDLGPSDLFWAIDANGTIALRVRRYPLTF
jgi:hypothetical protein